MIDSYAISNIDDSHFFEILKNLLWKGMERNKEIIQLDHHIIQLYFRAEYFT